MITEDDINKLREAYDDALQLTLDTIEKGGRDILSNRPEFVMFGMVHGTLMLVHENGKTFQDHQEEICDMPEIKRMIEIFDEFDRVFFLSMKSMRFTTDGETQYSW